MLVFKDIYSVDAVIFQNREWKKFIVREHKDLEKIMKNQLEYFLVNDFEIYENLDNSFNKLKLSVLNADSLTKEMIKIVKMMKKKKIIDLDEVSSKTDLTYRAMIKRESDIFLKTQVIYDKNKSQLKSIFKKLDQKLIFIKEEVLPIEKKLSDLKYKREEIKIDMDKYMDTLNKILFDSSKSEYSSFILESSKKIEQWRKQLDSFEKFLENINAIARKEAGGFVVLRGKDDEPMKYIKRYNKGVEEYILNIERIHKLVKLF